MINSCKYLGSVLTRVDSPNAEIHHRAVEARKAIGALRRRALYNKAIPHASKVRFVESFVLSRLLYGSESWGPISQKALGTLESVFMEALVPALGLPTYGTRPHNAEVRARAGVSSVEVLLARIQLKWLTKVVTNPNLGVHALLQLASEKKGLVQGHFGCLRTPRESHEKKG